MDKAKLNQVKEWHQLLKDGIITQSEFDEKKDELLGNNNVQEQTETENLFQTNIIEEKPAILDEIIEDNTEYFFGPTEEKIESTQSNEPTANEYNELDSNKKSKSSLGIILSILAGFALIAGILLYHFNNDKNSKDIVQNIDTTSISTTNSSNSLIPPVQTSSSQSFQFTGYYKGDLRMGNQNYGGSNNAECTIYDDGSFLLHYTVYNQQAYERGVIVNDGGNRYIFKENTGGKYPSTFENSKLTIYGNGWGAKLYLNGNRPESRATTVNTDKYSEYDENSNNENDASIAESKIRDLALVENSRNINNVPYYFSNDVVKYFDINYPTIDQIKGEYLHLWEITATSTRTIKNIQQVRNDYGDYNNYKTFVTSEELEYFGNKTKQTKVINNRIKYVFDNNNKIVSIDLIK